MKIVIRSSNLRELTARKTGQVYFIQTAALETGDDFPHPFDIFHDDKGKAYPPGNYAFAPDAIYVDRSGKLSVSPRLVPLPK